MALLAAKTQRVLATGVYSGLAVTALLGAIALGNGVRLALTTPLTAVSSSPQPAVTARIDAEPLREVPTGLLGEVAGVAQARDFTLVLGADGRLWARGLNTRGQLGVGIAQTVVADFLPLPGREYQAVAAGGSHALALDRHGNLWVWGDDRYGQLGNGQTSHAPQDRPIWIGRDIVAIAAGDRHSLAVRRDGTLLAWGENRWGEVGNGAQEVVTTPTPIGQGFASVAAGAGYSMAIDRKGRLWAWGRGEDGRLGTGDEKDQARPVQIGENFSVCFLSCNVKTMPQAYAMTLIYIHLSARGVCIFPGWIQFSYPALPPRRAGRGSRR